MKLQTKKKHTSSCFERVVTIEIFISINILSKYTQFVHCKMYSEIKDLWRWYKQEHKLFLNMKKITLKEEK